MSEKHGPNGFLVGLLIGGAAGALLSSKKGRKILKDIADYGLEYVGNSINMEDIESMLEEDEEEMYADELDMTKGGHERDLKHEAKETTSQTKHDSEPETRRKRLFRGIRRK